MKLNIFIGNKIKQARKNEKMTQEELATKLKTTRQSISRYENGERRADQNILFRLADIFDVSIDYFFPTTVSKTNIQNIYDQLNKHNKAQFIEYGEKLLDNQNKVIHLDDYMEETQNEGVQLALHGRLSAGTGTINYDKNSPEQMIYYGEVPKHDLCFQVQGDSMIPLFKDGEIIFIERTYDIRNGQVIAVSINDEGFVKKAYLEDNHLRLVSLNKNYDDIVAGEFDDIRVIGRVIL